MKGGIAKSAKLVPHHVIFVCTASFLLYHLSRNPDAQEKLRAECESVGEDASSDLMKKMRGGINAFNEKCVNESMILLLCMPLMIIWK